MDAKLSSNVADLSDEQRNLLESLTGMPLLPGQVLYWVVVNLGKAPVEADKIRARDGITELFAKVDRRLEERNASSDEFDAAVEEAVRFVRSRPDE